jgi:hypothetical protein
MSPKATRDEHIDDDTTTAGNSPVLEEEVRSRAYEIYLERGGQPGYDLDDWLQAERELQGDGLRGA